MPFEAETRTSEQVLPPLYARWVSALLEGAVPPEEQATCSDCAMCAPAEPAGGRLQGEELYSPVTKCCTYVPQLHNFLVGRVLTDEAPESAAGRRTVERRLEARIGVTPLGLRPSRTFDLVYQESAQLAFGRAESLKCPHLLEGGRCGVWKHRESTCATWFCKHERGLTGRRFWERVHDLLAAAEVSASRHCVLELGAGLSLEDVFVSERYGAESARLSASEVDGVVDEAAYRARWGSWLGKERDFYRECAKLVDALTWEEVLAHGGAELLLLARLTRSAYERLLANVIPERLVHREVRVLHVSPESVRVVSYSRLDPLKLPRALVDALHCFDGRPTREALDVIALKHRLRLKPGLVQKLVDFGILEEALEGDRETSR